MKFLNVRFEKLFLLLLNPPLVPLNEVYQSIYILKIQKLG
jgi:hypothetical protein